MSAGALGLRRRLTEAVTPVDGLTGNSTLDALEWFSRWVTLAAYLAAVMVFIAAPILALSWSNQPFAGLVVEPTLVTNELDGEAWPGRREGIRYPMRVVRVDGLPVATTTEFDRLLATHSVGARIPIITQFPDGNLELFPAVELIAFPRSDLHRLFWIPYLVGLAYLLIGIWIYSLRGRTRPGRALAFFCVATALACGLLFDLSTTHAGSAIWTMAVAQLGGALISLALRFPEEWRPVHRHPWLLAIPYAASLLLGLWGVAALQISSDPWAYVQAWGAGYRFAAFGVLAFLITMLYRARPRSAAAVRRQARIVLFFSLLAFAPIVTWFVAPLAGLELPFNAPLLLLPLLIFPIGIGLAILRYRLWAVDRLVNRTLVYVTLTALLGGLYTASIGLSQRVFVALTGEKSDAAIVMTTLVVASAFTPAKSWLQSFVDRQFKEERDRHRALHALAERARAFSELTDTRRLAARLLEDMARDLQAESGTISLHASDGLRPIATYGPWRGDARMSLPLRVGADSVGLLQLGPRGDGQPYDPQDLQAILPLAGEVARVVRWTQATPAPPIEGTPSRPRRP